MKYIFYSLLDKVIIIINKIAFSGLRKRRRILYV